MSITVSEAIRRAAEELRRQARMVEYRTNPTLWIKDRLGIDLWSIQREIAESVVHNKYTVVKSCHAAGKTFLAALLVCWWIDVHPGADTVVVTTAPSADQVRKIMWEYIRKIHREAGLSGRVTEQAEWRNENRDVVGYGRKPSDTNMNVIQGEHKKYTLVIIDEAGGVPPNIWVGADAITTMDTNRIMAIGNPDSPNTQFGRIFLEPDKFPEWKRFTISALDTPNFTDERDEVSQDVLDKLVSVDWVESRKVQWGINDALYQGRVLAKFPASSYDALFGVQMLSESRDLDLIPSTEARPILGVDVARFGDDRTVVVSNTDGVLDIAGSWSGADTVETAQRVHEIATRLGAKEVRVDGTGIGAGVVDQLARVPQAMYRVVEIIGAAKSPDNRKWGNFRAYMFDNLRTLVLNKSIKLPGLDPDDEPANTLNDELLALRYKVKPGTNVMMIESKDQMRKRGVKSPDFADAVAYACVDYDSYAPDSELTDGDVVSVDATSILDGDIYSDFIISPV